MTDPIAALVAAVAALSGLIGFVVRWLISRETATVTATLARIDRLESEVDEVRADQSATRSLKHRAENEAAGMFTAVKLLTASGRDCTCGAMTKIVELVDEAVLEDRRR